MTLLLFCLLLATSHLKAQKKWSEISDAWNVRYDVNQGAIFVKVLVYDLDFGPANEDGAVDWAHLQFSTDGANFTNFYYIDYDLHSTTDPSRSSSSGPRGSTGATYVSTVDGRKLYWEVRLNLTNSLTNIRKIKIEGNWDVGGVYGSSEIKAEKDITITQMTTINNPTYEFVTVQNGSQYEAKARISYTKPNLTAVDNRSVIQLYNSNGTAVSGNMSVSTSGSFDAAVSRGAVAYYYAQSAYDGRVGINSGSIAVPAFILPHGAVATYDSVNHRVDFNWFMLLPSPSNTDVVTDRFKLQVANNPNFTDAREISVDYDRTKSTYSYSVNDNLFSTMYFRVARARNGFNWELAKTASVNVPFRSLNGNTVRAELIGNTAARLRWTPLASAWLPGSTFIIKRTNNTSRTETEIRLNKADFDKGEYLDQQIAICNEYSYSLQVVPPTSGGFSAYAPVQAPGSILPTEIGTIMGLAASKGYFPDRTELHWSAQGAFDNFIVKRAIYGTNSFVQLSTVAGSSNSDFQTDDAKGTPGVYYTYMIVGVVRCNNRQVYSKDTLYAVGFRSPTGTIYGRITYENGQAVEEVSVRLQSNDAAVLGKSIALNGGTDSYLRLDSLHTAFVDSAFTVEAWIRPTDAAPVNQVLFSRSGQYELGFNAGGRLYFTHNSTTVTAVYSNPNQTFVHLAGIRTADSLLLMLDDKVVGRTACAQGSSLPAKAVLIGRNTAGNGFKGLMDEMRIWNVAISESRMARDYTRMLTGNEPGLVAYWRFDESITDQFYDLSYRSDDYNRNDGTMNRTAVSRSATTPTAAQLSLKAYTDASGNYMISGIPFTGNGTSYTIVPLLGTHQFDPVSVNRFISPTSLEFTVDFKNKSSFPVSGYVYYNESTVPVQGVQFQIDGRYAQQNNGSIIETDENGLFTISVPVGTHEVKALKANHVFVNGGKITDRLGNNLNYQEAIAGRQLYDSTTVRFIGRVGGGAIQEQYPLGHSLSGNNLGKELSVLLGLPSGNKYELFAGNGSSKTVINKHLLPSNQSDTAKTTRTTVVYGRNNITVYPDPTTGEFVVNLIPEKFLVQNVMATGWGDILDGKPVSLDLTNKFSVSTSINSFRDSTQNSQGAWVYQNYLDTVSYNASYKFIKRVTPSVSITQTNNGKELPYFGHNELQTTPAVGQPYKVSLIDSSKTGLALYSFGRPVFLQNNRYTFLVKAFEQYPFYESVQANGVPLVKQKDGKDVIANVPTQDGFVSLLNNLRNGATAADTMSLDGNGQAAYTFLAGDPDLASGGLKNFAATVRFGQSLNIAWNWLGSPQMAAYVIGGKLTGNDFVTAGPEKVLMVLRDPPGKNSFSYIERGSVITSNKSYSGALVQQGEESWTKKLGTTNVTFTGLGGGVINTVVAQTGITLGLEHEERLNGSYAREETTTLTTRFQTSADPLFVGGVADVFVGYSTNITYGQSNNIIIIRRSELAASDKLLYEPDPVSSFVVVQRGGISFGERFGTLFAYPQQHIDKILIPNLRNIRNTTLLPPTTSAADAQQKANTSNKPVYVSKLATDHPNFGKSNSDTKAFGAAAEKGSVGTGPSYTIYFPASMKNPTDTILYLNQYIQGWIDEMAKNEKAKLEAALVQNYSFHAGSPVEHSKQTSVKTTHERSFNIVVSGNLSNSSDVTLNGTGFEFKLTEKLGTEQGGTFTDSNDSLATFGFTLSSAAGTDDYFSVDVAKAADSSFIFRTKGGVSSCPYHGATVTQFYQPGTILDQPTQRAEVPSINVEKPVVSNVPSSRAAAYELKLRNESEARLPQTFILRYADNDSIKGATIAVDGASIGSGRAVVVQYGETVTKVLTITKGPTAMDYNNIMILLTSGCQYDPTGYQENIADTVLLSAHFIPSCSDIRIKAPTDKWIVNTGSPVNGQQKRYLPVTIDQFDVNNSLFHHIELQYKPAASATWITAMQFYADSTRYNDAQGEKQFISNPAAILFNLEVDDAAFIDQNYDIQAVSFCETGPATFITTASNTVSGIKDTYHPRLFGSPQPANGILGISDEVRLNFNETIAAGLLTPADFQVTGIRNGIQGNHSVAVRLDGQKDYVVSEFSKNLAAKNISAELWVLPTGQANETVFSHGDASQSLELALTADNHLQVKLGTKTIRSEKAFAYKAGEWAHVALVYNAVSKTVSAYYNFQQVVQSVVVDPYTGNGRFEFGRSVSSGGNYFSGRMHEARVWNDTLSGITLQVNSLTQFSGAENKLLAYYPMNEGKGETCIDKAHGAHAKLIGQWSTPPGKAVRFTGDSYLKLNTAHMPVSPAMDYTVELWFKAEPGQANATLVSNGKGDGREENGSLNLFSLGFRNGLLTYRNNGFAVQADGNYLDNKWHHVAVAVNRNAGNAQLLVDGQLKRYFDATNLGGMAAAATYLGVTAWQDSVLAGDTHYEEYFKGHIDEFRIWNTYLNQTLIANGNNIRLSGDELGLLAYYPFDKYITFQGNPELAYSLGDFKKQTYSVPEAVSVKAEASNEVASIKDRGPVSPLRFDFVVNNDALIINLLEPRQVIDKTIVTFKVKNVRDMNGNLIASPLTWTAYIDRNQLKWADRELTLTKDHYAALSFESYLVNSGGTIQPYRLDNLPSWLTASPASGSVAPTGRQKISFTVNPGLNIGSYDELLFVRNDNNEADALKVNLQVNGKEPDWMVNATAYPYSMNIYGKIRLNNVFSVNKGDKLAAFYNGKCVGVTTNTYQAANDFWYAFLTVYSDSLRHNGLSFQIWQASTGKTFLATPAAPIPFTNNAVAGTSTNPVIFDGKEAVVQNIVLNEKWNWISLNVSNQAFTNVDAALKGGKWTSGNIIKNELQGFNQYAGNGGWIGTLKALDNQSLYMLHTSSAQTLSLTGTPVDVKKTGIPLKGGRWNYISYLPQVNITVKEALSGYAAAEEDVIKSQTGFAMYSTRNGWVGNLTHLEPGKGYMLYRKSASDTTFFYPGFTGSLTNQGTGRVMGINPAQQPVAANFGYAGNMVVTAVAGSQFALKPSDDILVFAGGELRARTKALNNPVLNQPTFFFTIGGEQAQRLTFMVERDGELVALAEAKPLYGANQVLGSLSAPLVLSFRKVTSGLTVYPNPFQQDVSVTVDLRQAAQPVADAQLQVYDVAGRLVHTGTRQAVVNGLFQTRWNGHLFSGRPAGAGVYFISVMAGGTIYLQKIIKQ